MANKGRAAGDSTHYTWVLRDLSTGKYDTTSTISLPSSTSVISRVLAKPQLPGWAYRTTLDSIAGVVQAFEGTEYEADLIDTFGDAEMAAQYLKENALTPDDVTKIAQVRGKLAHKALEDLADVALRGDDAAADAYASRILDKDTSTPFDKATASWWVDRQPSIMASEMRMHSLEYGYAGTVDLIWRDEEGRVTITDLKSRRAGLTSYESDHIQVGSYSIMYEEMNPVTVECETVLVVRDDGTWDEYTSDLDNRGIFLDLLSVYQALTRR